MRRGGVACDTSLLVPALLTWHVAHEECRSAFTEDVTHLPSHVLLEAYSVLTRLPAPHRLTPADAAELTGALGRPLLSLPAGLHPELVSTLAGRGVRGGSVYDALVASTAAHHGVSLLTRDRRATSTYDVVGVTYRVL